MTDRPRVEGSLAERDLPDLVQDLHERRWSGVLTLTHMGIGRSITFKDGRLVFATSSSPDDRLGELLLRSGTITLDQYIEGGAAVVRGGRLGTILVERGILSPKDLVSAVVGQTQAIIYNTFLWTEGHYHLREGGDLGSDTIALNISTPDLIVEGIRRIEAWSRVERGVGGARAQYLRADDYESVLAQMAVSFERLSLLTELNGTRDVATICRESSLTDFEVCRILWAFRVVGLIRRVDLPAVAVPVGAEDEGLGAALAAVPETSGIADSLAERPPEPPSDKKRILLIGVEPRVFERIDAVLNRSCFALERIERAADALARCSGTLFDLLIVRLPTGNPSFEDFLTAIRKPGAPCAGAHLLALADEGRLPEAQGTVRDAQTMTLPVGEPGKLLEEVAFRLLGAAPRVSTRLLVRMEVKIEAGKQLVMCQSENFSLAGMLLRTEERYRIGTTVAFEFQPPGDRSPIQGEAEVVRHSVPDIEKVRGVGLRFLGFKTDGAKRLDAFLKRQAS